MDFKKLARVAREAEPVTYLHSHEDIASALDKADALRAEVESLRAERDALKAEALQHYLAAYEPRDAPSPAATPVMVGGSDYESFVIDADGNLV